MYLSRSLLFNNILGAVDTVRRKNLNAVVSLWKHIKCFSVHTTPDEFKNAASTGHFGFVFKETSVRYVTWLSWRQNAFRPHESCKAGVFKFLHFAERLRWPIYIFNLVDIWKILFSWWISLDGRPASEMKLSFQITSAYWASCLKIIDLV